MQFSLQLNFNQPKFTAFGLFTIDATLVYTVGMIRHVDQVGDLYVPFTDCGCHNHILGHSGSN